MILDFGFLGIIVFNLHVKCMVINIIILLRLRVSKLTVGIVGLQVYNPPVPQMLSVLCSVSFFTMPN